MKSLIEANHNSTMGNTILWTSMYFLLLLFITSIDIAIWRKITGAISVWLNIITMITLNILYFYVLTQKSGFRINLFYNVSMKGIVLAIGCAFLFYLILDKFLDPIFEEFFPMSEVNYQETLNTLRQAPLSSFLRICLIAPIIEEVLMRGYVLGGLQNKYGMMTALIVSAVLFSFLHFNMVQTLSALICGVVLGILYINTGSIFSCIIAHCLYNTISYTVMIYSYS